MNLLAVVYQNSTLKWLPSNLSLLRSSSLILRTTKMNQFTWQKLVLGRLCIEFVFRSPSTEVTGMLLNPVLYPAGDE